MLGKIDPLIEELNQAADAIAAAQRSVLAAAAQQARVTVARSRAVAFGLIAFCLLAGARLFAMVRGICRVLRQLAGEMTAATEHVAGAVRQIASSSQTLAAGASQQAASLEQTSGSSEGIRAMAHGNAANAQAANRITADADAGMSAATRKMQELAASMEAIHAAGAQIGRILKTIDAIAFQTNILALNAAVEAARAGDAGSGFAVVAGEVRDLAQRSAQAARETAELIDGSLAAADLGRQKVADAAAAMRAVAGQVAELRGIVAQVDGASEKQAAGLAQMAEALTQISRVTDASAASAEQNAASGMELDSQTITLKSVAGRLTALV
jgi:methyl-accepting chemotaxis protein/methyl-accepting chemotaxis protein-1 (serine sensor receptor)